MTAARARRANQSAVTRDRRNVAPAGSTEGALWARGPEALLACLCSFLLLGLGDYT